MGPTSPSRKLPTAVAEQEGADPAGQKTTETPLADSTDWTAEAAATADVALAGRSTQREPAAAIAAAVEEVEVAEAAPAERLVVADTPEKRGSSDLRRSSAAAAAAVCLAEGDNAVLGKARLGR